MEETATIAEKRTQFAELVDALMAVLEEKRPTVRQAQRALEEVESRIIHETRIIPRA